MKRCAYCGKGEQDAEGDEVIMCDDCWRKAKDAFMSAILLTRLDKE